MADTGSTRCLLRCGCRPIERGASQHATRCARAAEDARCEEALRRAGYGEETGATPGDAWDDGYDSGARAAIDAMREWPDACAMYRDVPLALWEIDERRRRETVRAVVALLTWGLS